MGYTHYWQQTRGFTKADWETATADMQAIILQAVKEGIQIDPDGTDPANFYINGMDEDAHETFIITKARAPLESWQTPRTRGSDICKTARKPYDVAVTACLIYLESVWPDHFNASSDGDPKDWKAGLDLAVKALPRYHNALHIPRYVTFEGQFTRWIFGGGKYAVRVRSDGAICVIDNRAAVILATFPAGPIADAIMPRLKAIEAKIPRSGKCDALDRAGNRACRTVLQAAPMWGGIV